MAFVRLLSRDNGAGLSRDLSVLRSILAGAGHEVDVVGFGGGRGRAALRGTGMRVARLWRGRADVQVFVERLYPSLFGLGTRNLLIPNPEWFPDRWLGELPRIDRVLCKTAHAQAIFGALGCATTHIGFSSEDRLDASVPRERAFFHAAGRSSAKGTRVLMDTWRRHPAWPRLTIVQSARKAIVGAPAANIDHRIGHLDDAEMRRLQNAHAFHACPSEMEGFGHVLMEAMGVGAITLTTDGAPMNELIRPDRGMLVAPASETRKDLSPRHFVDTAGIETGVEALLALDGATRAAMAIAARAFFDQSSAAFRDRLLAAIDT